MENNQNTQSILDKGRLLRANIVIPGDSIKDPTFVGEPGSKVRRAGQFVFLAYPPAPNKEGKLVQPPSPLAPFKAIRQRFVRLGLRFGVKLGDSSFIPNERREPALKEAKAIVSSFDARKDEFLKAYPSIVQQWANANPADRELILSKAPPVSFYAEGLKCRVDLEHRIAMVEELDSYGLQSSTADEVGGMVGQLAAEIAADIKDSIDITKASSKVRNVLKRVNEKVHSLAFLDRRVLEIATFIDTAIQQLPTSGKIEGHDFLVLKGLIDILQDPKLLLGGKLEISIEEEPVETQTASLFDDAANADSDTLPAIPPVNTQSGPVITGAAFNW